MLFLVIDIHAIRACFSQPAAKTVATLSHTVIYSEGERERGEERRDNERQRQKKGTVVHMFTL